MASTAPFKREHPQQYVHIAPDMLWRIWKDIDSDEWYLVSFDGREYERVFTGRTMQSTLEYFKQNFQGKGQDNGTDRT